MPLIKTIIFTVLVPGTATILIPRWLIASDQSLPVAPCQYLGLVPIAIGAAIYFWCAWDFATAGRGTPVVFDPPKNLVVRGLYRYVRNPMYVGILSILFGEAALFASTILLCYATAIALLFHFFVVLYEEPALGKKFGESYRKYRASVPRWLPRFNNQAERPAR